MKILGIALALIAAVLLAWSSSVRIPGGWDNDEARLKAERKISRINLAAATAAALSAVAQFLTP